MNNCKAFACAEHGCGHTIHLHHDLEDRYRRTQETFYCPAGHSNYFPAKKQTEEDRLRRKLAQTEKVRDRFRDLWEDATDRMREWRNVARTCPFGCGYRVKRKWKIENVQMALVDHFITEHGAEFYVPEIPIEETVEA